MAACGERDFPTFESSIQQFPRPRDLKLQPEQLNMSLVDFFSLGDCELQALVAERNNALGRVMTPSKNLVYEHHFLLRAQNCLYTLLADSAENADLVLQLKDAIRVKQQNKPIVFWNATLANPEFAGLFSLAKTAAPNRTDVENTASAMQTIAGFYNSFGLTESELDLEPSFRILQSSGSVSTTLKKLERLTFALNHVAETLEKRMRERPVCVNGVRDTEANELIGLFKSYYIKRLQPEMAQYQQYANALLPVIETLITHIKPMLPPAFKTYYAANLSMQHEASIISRFRNAVKRHSSAWQTVLDACGLTPGDLL